MRMAVELDMEMDYPLMVANDWVTPRSMPEQKPGRSEQVVATPKDFLLAAAKRLNDGRPWDFDLAASDDNAVAPSYYTEQDDALVQRWNRSEDFVWCNPPYADIAPWVHKAYSERALGASVAMLVPASTGSNWWAQWVNGKAYVTFLNGRITFVGHTSPYPKDLALLLYAPFLEGGSTVWRWK